MALVLVTKQWIWLMKTLEEHNVLVTIAAMLRDNKAPIDIANNHKIGDQSNQIEVTYHLVSENVESG
jgi:hypothetical protein